MKRRDFIKTGAISIVASSSILTQCDNPIKNKACSSCTSCKKIKKNMNENELLQF